MSFFAKVLALALGLVVTVLVLSNLTFTLTARQVLVRGLGREAVQLALRAREDIDVERYERLLRGDTPVALHRELVEELRRLQRSLGPHGIENLYTLAVREGGLYVIADPSGDDLPFAARDTANVALKTRVLQTGVPESTDTPYADEWGTWISGYAPIRGRDGSVIALLGADLPLGAFPLMNVIIRRNILVSLVPALVVTVLASLYVTRRLTTPIRRLTHGLRQVRAGDLAAEVAVASRDEIGEMAEAFNRMTRGLREKEQIRGLLQQAVSREVAEAMLSGRVSTEGELREVSVLFADIRGFTALSETIPAREVIALINDYLAMAVPAIMEHGGVVDKFVGDEIFAVFGAPLVLPDDAVAAVRAGLAMKQRLAALNQERLATGRPPIEIGVGINSGAAIAGAVGPPDRRNYTVLGVVVNHGARLCAAAAAGQVLVSQTTFNRVQRHVTARALPPLSVKGLSYPLAAFEVLDAKEQRDA